MPQRKVRPKKEIAPQLAGIVNLFRFLLSFPDDPQSLTGKIQADVTTEYSNAQSLTFLITLPSAQANFPILPFAAPPMQFPLNHQLPALDAPRP